MLYKYVKSEPIVRKTPKRGISPHERNKFIFTSAVIALITGFLSLSYSIYPYASAAIYGLSDEEGADKSVLSSKDSWNEENSSQGQIGSLSSTYTANLIKNLNAASQELLIDPQNHPELATRKGEMKITIPRLKISKMPVVINVDSYNDKSYLPVLDKKLAHFKGTSLPDNAGNTFIYGHSTNELIARANPQLPQVAFTFLNKLELGDEITIEMNGENYKYVLQKSKVVEPEDISPIFSKTNSKTLTLMTCWPPGVGEKRLILVANQV